MSGIKGKVGAWELTWKSIPRGPSGVAQVEAAKGGEKHQLEVRWRKDQDGLWLELPHGVYGFDLEGERNEDGRLEFLVTRRSSSEIWKGLSFLRAGEESVDAAAGGKKKGFRIRAQMPGKIIRVGVEVGARVEKDQSLLVMEAMKMENEIRAPASGVVSKVHVTQGQAVETGADLCLIEPAG